MLVLTNNLVRSLNPYTPVYNLKNGKIGLLKTYEHNGDIIHVLVNLASEVGLEETMIDIAKNWALFNWESPSEMQSLHSIIMSKQEK